MVFGLFSSDKDKKAKEEPKKAEPKSPKKAATPKSPKSPKKADAKAASGPTKIDTFEKHVSLTWEDVPVQVDANLFRNHFKTTNYDYDSFLSNLTYNFSNSLQNKNNSSRIRSGAAPRLVFA